MLGAFVFFKRRNKVNQTFLFLSIVIAGYVFGNFLIEIATLNYFNLLFAQRLTIFFAALHPPIILMFALYYPTGEYRISLLKLITYWIPSLFFSLISFTSLYIDHMFVEQGLRYGTFKWSYKVFAVYFGIYLVYSLYLLYQKYHQEKYQQYKNHLQYIFFGFFVSYSIGSVFSLILPILGIHKYEVFGPIGVITLLGLMAYAILRHKLMDIKVLVRSKVAAGFVIIIFLLIYYFIEQIPPLGLINFFVKSAYITFGILSFHTFRTWLTTEIDYTEILSSFIKSISYSTNRKEISERLRDHLLLLGYENLAIYFTVDNEGIFRLEQNTYETEMPDYYVKQTDFVMAMTVEKKDERYYPHGDQHIFKMCKEYNITLGLVFLSGNNPMNDRLKGVTVNICFQAALALSNALYRETMEEDVEELNKIVDMRTIELALQNEQLQEANEKLEHTIEEKDKLEKAVVQAGRNAIVGRIAGGIAHEIKNPLATVQSLIRNMKRHPEMIQEYYDQVMHSIDHCFEVIHALQTSFHAAEIHERRLNLKTIIEQALLLFRMGDSVKVELQLEDAYIKGSPTELQQIVINLLSNARDAMDGFGNQLINIRLANGGEYVILEIEDHGVGMSEEIQEHIFIPFYTTKSPGSGTGLGLHIVKSIIEKHRASIEVKSEENKGTCFILTFIRVE
ncbi:MAG TPA: hypothetical protein DF296_07160 [Candidatus Margulisbacteria bacterium]|nr:hypothetical protein [Candidatus Margulisiibacteriota bacterium]